MGVDWAVAVFPALLRTKEFPEELPVEGVEDFGAQSFGNLLSGTFSLLQCDQTVFRGHKHTWDSLLKVLS